MRRRQSALARTAKCRDCPKRTLPVLLIGGRCEACRRARFLAAKSGGFYSPYTAEGQRRWQPKQKLGPRGGLYFERREKLLSMTEAKANAKMLGERFPKSLEPTESGKVLESEE